MVLQQGNTVKAWSGGTEEAGIGAHAYTLQPCCCGDDNAFKGDNGTPGHPNSMASNRTESFRVAAILLVALAIKFKYDVQDGFARSKIKSLFFYLFKRAKNQ